ncbi:MAG TPA: TetR family transcriptional regulator [Microlunatus sp.]
MVGARQARTYDSSNRRAQALRTRERILDEARRLFIANGFAATSIAAVAAAAQVSSPTVFSAFGSKVNLLKEAAETTIVGDARPIPMAERAEMQHVRDGKTAEDVLRRFAALVAARSGEIYPIYSVIYNNRDGYPEIATLADLLDDQRLTGAKAMAQAVLTRLEPEERTDEQQLAELRDCLWALMSLAWYEAFVVQRGWSVAAYQAWLSEAMIIPLRRRAASTPATSSRI